VRADLQLWSFYEGVPTTCGPKSFLVAILDLPDGLVQLGHPESHLGHGG